MPIAKVNAVPCRHSGRKLLAFSATTNLKNLIFRYYGSPFTGYRNCSLMIKVPMMTELGITGTYPTAQDDSPMADCLKVLGFAAGAIAGAMGIPGDSKLPFKVPC